MTDLRVRGVQDILIACIDGLKGFPEAIEATFPKTQVQVCVAHQIRTSLRDLATKYHKEFLADLKEVYKASTLDNAELALDKLKEKWNTKAPSSVACWYANWRNLSTFFQFPPEVLAAN